MCRGKTYIFVSEFDVAVAALNVEGVLGHVARHHFAPDAAVTALPVGVAGQAQVQLRLRGSGYQEVALKIEGDMLRNVNQQWKKEFIK